MDYRREIDGLRALAVVPVILFHAGFELFGGGYVGVDVFFVISGYLITGIILSELKAGHFSLLKFYERRARRILPALLLVMVVSWFFGWLWLVPGDMKEFAKSLVAVSLFSSNVLFWQDSGYFATASELKPLLHTWSLAVEEQYYVVFPLLLMAAWRWARRWILAILAVMALASLVAAEWGVRSNPSAAFFLLPTRAWELLLGAFIAFHVARNDLDARPVWAKNAGSAVGLLLVVLAVFAFDERTPFPGLYALVPVVGTGLIILYATPQTLVGRILGHRALVGIGLISYSAYLWHQPLFVFARHRSLETPDPALYGLLSVASLVLAYLSWRFVEMPFRDKSKIDRKGVFRFAAVAVTLPLVFGLVGYMSNGFYQRDDLQARLGDLDARLTGNYGLSEECEGEFTLSAKCRTSDKPEILLWGDSYAMHLAQAIIASNQQARIIQMTMSVCGPFLGVAPTNEKYPGSWASKCIEVNDKVLAWLKSQKSVKYAVLSSPLTTYIADGSRIMLRNGDVVAGHQEALRYFKDTLGQLRELGITPVVVSTTPQTGNDLGRCLAKMTFLELPLDVCSFDRSMTDARQKRVLDFLREIEKDTKVIWLADGICPAGKCQAAVGDVLIYRDNGHLAREGSAYIGQKVNFYQAITAIP